MDKNLIQRLISGFFYGLIIFLCTTTMGEKIIQPIFPAVQQQYLYYGLISFLLLVGTWECIRIMKFDPKGWEQWITYPIVGLIFYRFSKKFFNQTFFFDPNASELLALFLLVIAIVTLFRFSKELYFDNGKLIFTVVYLAIPFGLALGLPKYNSRESLSFTSEVFMLFVLIWSSDSFAYFSGRLFGKHKMAPKISPKKTWEGFAGGVVLTLILGFFIEKYFPELRGNWMVVGFLVATFAPLGDLVESQLKRSFGVKDSGNIIPGHGGVLDRLDSFIICVPVIYLYFILERLF
ncbi:MULTISPECIES: phosphatidate cytidylyltransferase [Amniculibacterium]|uniref:phosphatidate cytidylyltransferase n=1 Tax=Amniculibacterium TaxID=2715289 RepID=UPI000F59334F|nr:MULTISPECIES: phosphatidate cytidylyltransferase [Amniculibacterium]